jgi:hypothetical protein
MSTLGVNSRRFWRAISVGILLVIYVALVSCIPMIPVTAPTDQPTAIPPDNGVVPINILDENGKSIEKGVIVRVSNSTQVDDFDNGGLKIGPCDQNTQLIAAWAKGYEVALRNCKDTNIQLTPLSGHDNIYYSWVSATGFCKNCHAGQIGNGYDEMTEWQKSSHAKVFDQRYFETMYSGTNLRGNSSPATQWKVVDNDLVRVPPEINDSYRGPGFKLDFPQQSGNCAYCHVPAAIPSSKESVDLLGLFPKPGDVRGEGITCDVCHKVLDVILDDNRFPFVDQPGVLSFRFLRPDNGVSTIGPFANILTWDSATPINHHLACSYVFSKSEFCAACHYGKFRDMTIYNSYGEWKKSAFGDNPNEPDFKTCQDCHMSHMDAKEKNPPPSKRQACSESDPGFQNFDHNVMNVGMDDKLGKDIPRMIRGAAKITVRFKYEPDKKNSLDVIARVENTKAGHKFPTDSPLRHLILVVDARDQLETSLIQVDGERIPNWGGIGKPFMDNFGIKNYGGLPGKIFANLLVEEDTNISPTAAYWNETKYAWVDKNSTSDTRLAPDEEDKSEYYFTVPDAGDVKVTVTLVYRYAFFDLIAEKEWWDRSDIIVTSVECEGPPTQPDVLAQSCKTVDP